ncbi:hypothetical protein J6590_106256, partial [Homalodisca vitripennis]
MRTSRQGFSTPPPTPSSRAFATNFQEEEEVDDISTPAERLKPIRLKTKNIK